MPTYSTTLILKPREFTATVTDDNPGGGPAGVASVRLFTKKGKNALYDSTLMNGTSPSYKANTPAVVPEDTVFWWVAATDVNGNRTQIAPRSYIIFKKSKTKLLIYNNAQYSLGTANLIYTNNSPNYDRWSAVNDGTFELPSLLALYNGVILGDGSSPARDVYPAIKNWIATGTPQSKKVLFFSSQNYGCFITNNCSDTAFAAGTFEYDYLGVEKIGPQDLPPSNREFRILPLGDTVTNYMLKFNADSGTTLWYDPTFELGFAGYPDAMTPRSTAKALFKDGAGTYTLGVKHLGPTFYTMYLGFDAGGLQFRVDTSKAPGTAGDKYAWIVDVLPPSEAFFYLCCTDPPPPDGIEDEKEKSPFTFSLGQNFPNPFNPTTTIEYSIVNKSNVAISIYNTLGQKVAMVVNEIKDAGMHTAKFNAQSLASGVYFYEMRSGSFVSVKKMLTIK